MEKQAQRNNEIYEDEIDLKELFLTLYNNKLKIILITVLVTLAAIVYVSFKNPIPIYTGNIMLEIGEVKSANSELTNLDRSQDLKAILERDFDVKVNTPRGTNSILVIVSQNSDKSKIKSSLIKVKDEILKRHSKKAKLFDSTIMTKQVGKIKIEDTPINKPKKKLIVAVAFVTGFILSIFLVFFMEFIKGIREEKK